ncbi:pantetheine-phosphate adenylyltransferase [Pajaroellobacter abortibovis]|uniref:Phosphopantetheine adenylyltransferase n=1 Tax=Pajaroellobacter abortibovis TaxID=1882918 RepID=A0A1L6MUY8_9BACT|nr:pantetheine-phosphate adenylyltransferase [Pajaroellobacter abortibovis]APR99334.1 pantetheine-phosphate adenylyltransferase [Pajaroellobacter abortibovis]
MGATIAVYAGSFDPITWGHLDLIERASSLFEVLLVSIGIHPTRVPLFTIQERLELTRGVVAAWKNVHVETFDGLLVDYCCQKGARVIVRGLRAVMDFENELQVAHANADLAPSVDTIFLPTRTRHGFVSASLVREIAKYGGDVSRYAPPLVCQALRDKFRRSA